MKQHLCFTTPSRFNRYTNGKILVTQIIFYCIKPLHVWGSSLHTSQVAYQARAYPGFLSMKRLRVFLLPPGWDASPSQGYPNIKFARTHLYTWVETGTVRVKCLAQEHNTMLPARAQTWTARSEEERTKVRPLRHPRYISEAVDNKSSLEKGTYSSWANLN